MSYTREVILVEAVEGALFQTLADRGATQTTLPLRSSQQGSRNRTPTESVINRRKVVKKFEMYAMFIVFEQRAPHRTLV